MDNCNKTIIEYIYVWFHHRKMTSIIQAQQDDVNYTDSTKLAYTECLFLRFIRCAKPKNLNDFIWK